MKSVVFSFFVFFLFASFASAACVEYYDLGNDPNAFGYVDADGVLSQDSCTSDRQLKEYYCSGSTLVSQSHSCAACNEGICYSSFCTEENICNPALHAWCSGGSWEQNGYCTDSNLECSLVDSSCETSICTEGVCDYNNHRYCSSNTWVEEDYCDSSHCGADSNSLSYCFCADTDESIETDCTDDIDDDCDGTVDCNDSDCKNKEGCLCENGDTEVCSSNEGECSSGTQMCVAGGWSDCSGIEARDEICDELDNDCDGDIDNDCTCVAGDSRDCGADIGVCKAGVQVCQEDATWSLCFGASYAASEIEECNGQDDDCDAEIDEGCRCVSGAIQNCGSSTGACRAGSQSCVNGIWSECIGDVEPSSEICGDLLDNDCDSQIDEEDDTCTDSEILFEEREVLVGDECSSDADCDLGNCARGICVAITSSSRDDIEEETSSSFSTGDFTVASSTNLFWYILPFFLILLSFLAFLFWHVRRKKKIQVSEKGVPQTTFSAFRSLSSSKTLKKGALDKKLEASFQESSHLFKK